MSLPKMGAFSVNGLCALGVVTLLAATSHADTVAWWHFDEADAGAAAAENSIACDEAPTLYAKPYSYAGSTGTLGSGDYLPKYAHPFIGRKVYDPVTGAVRSNRSAMSFKIARGGSNPTTDSGRAYYGGLLKVENSGSLYYSIGGETNLTIECFVCTTGTEFYLFAPVVAAIVGNNWTAERYAIWMQTDGRIGLRFTTTSGSAAAYYNDGTKKVNDGAWHHVAFTYDGNKIAIYVDYEPDTFSSSGANRTYARTGAFASYPSDTATWIGGYPDIGNASSNGYRRFPGCIDEVRISNAVLTPDQFLRLQPEANPASDSDEVLRIRFDSEVGALNDQDVVDGKFGGVQAIFNAVSGADASVLDTTVFAGANVYDGIFANAGVSNVASFCQTTNAAGKAGFIKVPKTADALWPDGVSRPNTNLNYTVEAFFKTRRSSPIRQTVFKLGTGGYLAAQFIFGDDNHPHQADFCFNNNGAWNNLGTPASKPLDDGNWHHVAFVSDASNRHVRVYCDYEQMGSKSGVTCMVSTGYSLFVGSKENGEGQFFDGWIDDVRVTRRVLRPEEFLTTHAVGSASPNPLLLARFEQNYTFESLADSELSETGVGEARTNGNAPTFVKASPGELLLDGTNGSNRVVNEYSVHLDKSRVVFPVSRLYEQGGAFTVEFWAKFTGFWESSGVISGDQAFTSGQAGILRFTQGDSGITYDWCLYRSKGDADTLQIATRILDGTVPDYPTWKLGRNVADGKWHHVAVTMEPFEDNGVEKTRIRLYDDYKLVNNGANDAYILQGRLHTNNNGYRLMVGESSTENPSVIGYVNSLRFTRGLLTPDKFMGRVRKGIVFIVR